jgi:hypothetical protein
MDQQPRAQRPPGETRHEVPDEGQEEAPPTPPADPDRPTDDVKAGNTLVEPAPGA